MTSSFENIKKQAESIAKSFFHQSGGDHNFPYHTLEHTVQVAHSAQLIMESENLKPEEECMLIIAVWFHDIMYLENPAQHEQEGAKLASSVLKELGAHSTDIELINTLILATDIKTPPKSTLEEIIKDADLHYLGTNRYQAESDLLRKEWELTKNLTYTDEEWRLLNIDFFKSHQFYRPYSLNHYEPIKIKNLEKLENSNSLTSNRI